VARVIKLKPAEAKAPMFSGGQKGEGKTSPNLVVSLEVKTISPLPTTTSPDLSIGAALARKKSPCGLSNVTSPTTSKVKDFPVMF
jgi:hypothetical protein